MAARKEVVRDSNPEQVLSLWRVRIWLLTASTCTVKTYEGNTWVTKRNWSLFLNWPLHPSLQM